MESLTLDGDLGKKRVLLIYTGGTIGMKRNEEGALEPAKGYLSTVLREHFPAELLPEYDIIEYDPLLDSSDIEPADWEKIGRDINQNMGEFDGFVVIHGTDTMVYTACALSFMFENLNKPVVLTGAQTPLIDVISDARRNLIVSMLIAAMTDIPEVCIFFAEQLLRGNRARKMDTWNINAFQSPNMPALAQLGITLSVNRAHALSQPRRRLRFFPNFCTDVVCLHVVPGFSDVTIKNLLTPQLKGMVILSYGCGNLPKKKTSFLGLLKEAIEQGIVVVAITQCWRGSVNFDTYATGRALQEIGVISGFDMTVECASVKLSWLLGQGLSPQEVARLMQVNMRGELTHVPHGPAKL